MRTGTDDRGLENRAHLGASDLQASPLSEGNGELWETYIKRRARVQAESPTAGFRFGFPHDPKGRLRIRRLQLLHILDDPRGHQRNVFCLQDDWLPLYSGTEQFGVQDPDLQRAFSGDLHEPAGQQDHRPNRKPLARALEELVTTSSAKGMSFGRATKMKPSTQ